MKIEKLEVSQHLDTRKLYEEVFSKDEKKLCRLLLSGEDEEQYNLYCSRRR